MKGTLLIIFVLISSTANAIEVLREQVEPAQLTHFSENLYGKDLKTCFVGSVTDVCSAVKATINRANFDLTEAGAAQRFKVEACAQNPDRAMVIYSLGAPRKLATPAPPTTRKTVFIEPCAGDQIKRITVTFN